MKDPKMYKYHVANMHSIEIAIDQTALSARQSIADENNKAIRSFVSLYAFLIGAWAENRLKKLLYEKDAFSPTERKTILVQNTQLDQWNKILEVSYRKHYKLPKAQITGMTIPLTAFARYQILLDTLNTDLQDVIEIRNKLAHGQWIYPFTNDGLKVETNKYNTLQNANLLALQFQWSLIKNLSNVIHDLVVSLQTFDRDFDKNFKLITNTRINLKKRSYQQYASQLIAKRRNGILKRKTAVQP
ncbi:MAG: hypothetical protein WC680_05885 [Sulfuricurvum sp.]|jgi:hypothetical protein